MGRFIKTYILIILVGLSSDLLAKEHHNTLPDTIYITADNWCPYSCLDTDENKGLLVEVVKAAFESSGINIVYKHELSWARAIQNTRDGTTDALLGADIENSNDIDLARIFYIYDETVFAVLKERNIQINEGKDLLKYKIGRVDQYTYDDDGLWEDYIEKHPDSSGINVREGEAHLLTLLERGRIDIAVINSIVAQRTIRDNPQLSKIDIIHRDVKSKLYVGFPYTERGKQLKKVFTDGFRALIGTKKLENIYNKYNIKLPNYDQNVE